jgi:hypothetical protein
MIHTDHFNSYNKLQLFQASFYTNRYDVSVSLATDTLIVLPVNDWDILKIGNSYWQIVTVPNNLLLTKEASLTLPSFIST